MRIERDNQGRTRVAKGDRSGLGGQYAPDVHGLNASRQRQTLNELNREDEEYYGESLWKKHYPSFIMAGTGVAASIPGAYAGVFNGLSMLGITLVAASMIVLGIRENK
jgi:hypothetical protein